MRSRARWGGTNIDDPLSILAPFDPEVARPGLRLLMVSTTGEHSAYFELDEALRPIEQELPDALKESVARIRENCEPALCTVLFKAGAGGSLRAAAVGENGELEHAAAILHPKLGTPVRRVRGKGAALIPSSKKRGGLGVVLDIPLGHKDAAFVRSHFDGMEVRLNDAPRANEIMVAIAVTDSGRPLARVGGLTKDQIKGEDGLR